MIGGEWSAEVRDPMGRGKEGGQESGGGSVGDGAWGKRIGETNAVLCESIERGRLNAVVTITVNVISTKGVDGDEVNVGSVCAFDLSHVTAGCQRANDENAEGPHAARLARRPQRSQMSATNHGRQ